MRKTANLIVGCLFLFVLGMVSVGSASTIILSGDSNIGNPLDGSGGAPVTAGNARFFSNILGSGTNVLIHDEYYFQSIQSSSNSINSYYNGLSGVSSSLFTGTIAATDLAGIDLYFSILPTNDYLGSEVTAISNFLDGGGTLFLIGENQNNFLTQNSRINSLLVSLGSSMRLGGGSVDPGFNTTSNIVVDPFTAGVTSFTYAFTNVVILGGNPLFRAVDTRQEVFIAYEGESAPIPEPATMLLLGTGLVGVAGAARRRNSKRT